VGEWSVLEYPTPITIFHYSIEVEVGVKASTIVGAPSDWNIVYSTDGVSYSIADAQTGQDTSGTLIEYTLATPITAKYWGLEITAFDPDVVTSKVRVLVNELRLYGSQITRDIGIDGDLTVNHELAVGESVTIAGNPSVVSTSGTVVDNSICRYDSTTGEIIQDTGVIIDDSDQITGINNLTSDRLDATLTMQLPVYTVSGAGGESATAGKIIYCSDETGGATLAFGDGTNFRRVQDRAIIS
jgi:hypothetical protein